MLLSICIPSYNRFSKLQRCIESILKAESDDFEIVVVDNASPDPIREYITTADPRVRIIERDKPVDGKLNIGSCPFYAKGTYAMLCLDKDFIDGERLDSFLRVLKENPQLCGGFCAFNRTQTGGGQQIFAKDAILAFGYLSKHPSGDFYKTEILFSSLSKFGEDMQADTFSFDLYLSECAVKGAMMMYREPLVFLEDPEDAVKVNSYTYKMEDNTLFFMPRNRIGQFIAYTNHLVTLHLPLKLHNRVLSKLYLHTLVFCTVCYQSLFRNQTVCRHYKIECREVPLREVLVYRKMLRDEFSKISDRFPNRFFAYTKGDVLVAVGIIRGQIKKALMFFGFMRTKP